MMKLTRRWTALLLALLLLCGALPLTASAAGYYAMIADQEVGGRSCTIYGNDSRLFLDEITVKPAADFYKGYDFYEYDNTAREYELIDSEDWGSYFLRSGDSVFVALYRDREAYRNGTWDWNIELSYSDEEFRIATEADSVYTLTLEDFDPTGAYGLKEQCSTTARNDGYLVINALPEAGELYLNNAAVSRGQDVALNDVRTGKLSYRAPSGDVTEDSFEFAAYTASSLILISRSVMYVDLTAADDSGLATSADTEVEVERDGTYVFAADDFDYSGWTYDVDDFTYVRITSLPDYGYLSYNGDDIRTSTWISLSDVTAGKLSYTLDSETDYSSTTLDDMVYVVYTANRNGVYTGTLQVDISWFSAAGYSYVVRTDTKGSRTFRLADFDDPDGGYNAADFTSTTSRDDGFLTLRTLPSDGTLQLDGEKLEAGSDVPLDDIRQGLLQYVPNSASDSKPDAFEFILFDAGESRIARDVMYIDKTPVRTGVAAWYGEDALVIWMTGEEEYTFALDDLNDPTATRPLSDYHDSQDEDADGYVELLSVPESGELTLYSGRSEKTLDKGDYITLDELDEGELRYIRDENATDAYASFTFCARDYRGRLVSGSSVTAYIDFYEEKPNAGSSYTYTLSRATKTLRVEFTGLSADAATQSVTAVLTAGDLTDLAAEAGFTGGTLELVADVKDATLSSRTVTMDGALFTDSSKAAVFSTIRLVATDAGQNTSGAAITNVCRLTVPVASVVKLYTMTTADFSLTLERYSMTASDKANMPNATYSGGLARRVSFFVGNTRVNVDDATLTLPYGKITVKPSTVIMMRQQSDGSFAPALSSRYNASDYTVTAVCQSGMVCTPYYRGTDSGMSFSDLSDPSVSWATEFVYSLAARDVVQGVGGGLYSPTAKVTRAEFIKMLVSSLGLHDEKATCSFTDIKGSSAEWAYSYIASAVQAGIIEDGKSFQPTKAIDRQTMALYAYRASLSGAADITLPTTYKAETFLDQSQISEANRAAVTAMQRAGIIQGDGAGHFDPTGTTTRAAAAKIICMLMQYKYQ